MRKYRPAKRATVVIYLLLTAILVAVTGAILWLTEYIGKFALYAVAVYWVIHAFFACVLIPMYFKYSEIFVSDEEIVLKTGMLTKKCEFMPMKSVKSVTSVITPIGKFTGLNFAIINALGSRIIILFLKKNDCLEISEYINSVIKSRA